jgi:SnoaL-like domain
MPYVRPILVLIAALVAAAACSQPDSPEQQVRTTIEQMELAAEQRNVGDLMEYVSNEYRDADGYGPKQISQYVRGYLVANQSIRLLTRMDEIEFPGDDEARAKVLVGMVSREADAAGAWDLAADLYEFDIALIREDGDWKVTYAKWIRR